MKRILLLLFFIGTSFLVKGQFNTSIKPSGIIHYDFNTYKGIPITKGWLVPDSTYRKLYLSYNAADSSFKFYQQQAQFLQSIHVTFLETMKANKEKNTADSLFIAQQKGMFNKLDSITTRSIKLSDRLIADDKKKISKFEAILLAIGTGLLGYLAGHH